MRKPNNIRSIGGICIALFLINYMVHIRLLKGSIAPYDPLLFYSIFYVILYLFLTILKTKLVQSGNSPLHLVVLSFCFIASFTLFLFPLDLITFDSFRLRLTNLVAAHGILKVAAIKIGYSIYLAFVSGGWFFGIIGYFFLKRCAQTGGQ